jgi:hypothetical protein
MNLPGFTAEASLKRSKEYYIKNVSADNTGSTLVSPALNGGFTSIVGCYLACEALANDLFQMGLCQGELCSYYFGFCARGCASIFRQSFEN